MSANKKIIAIVGATGNQGGSLLQAIVNEGAKSQFVARALSRTPDSEKSQAIKKLGVEVVKADLGDEEALLKAIQGCYGMFCMTPMNFANPESEVTFAKNMASAAKKAGIKHLVWSTLEDTRKFYPLESTAMPTVKDKYKVPHFDVKGDADAHFKDLPTTYLLTPSFWDNWLNVSAPRKMPDGSLGMSLPMANKLLPGIAVEDIGKCSLGLFKNPSEYVNKRVGIVGENLTMGDITAKMTKVLGRTVKYNEITVDGFRKMGFPNCEIFANQFQFIQEIEQYRTNRSVDVSRKLNPELMSFEQWFTKNKHRLAEH